VKCWGTIFHAQVGPVRSHKKRTGTCYARHQFSHPAGSVAQVVHSDASVARNIKLLFLRPVGSAGHVVNSGASMVRNTDALFSCSGGTSME
jgi:hypothetical protein